MHIHSYSRTYMLHSIDRHYSAMLLYHPSPRPHTSLDLLCTYSIMYHSSVDVYIIYCKS